MNRWRHLFPVAIVLVILGPVGAWAQDAGALKNNLVYQIFVRSFCDGKPDAKGVGDLAGITSKLDTYLNDGNPNTHHDLAAGILWLMPIFPASSYHGYDVTDFKAVNPEYGDTTDLKALLQAAHQRGVRVILDIPFNHTSRKHPWFKEVLANPASPRRGFYHIQPVGNGCPPTYHEATGGNGEKFCYQGVFGDDMPDLNVENPEVKQEIFQIARFWLNQGVDGFRLDAAKHLIGEGVEPGEPDILKNNDFWRDFSFFIYGIKPDAVLVGEVLGDQERLRRFAFGLDALIDEPFLHAVRNNVKFPGPGLLSSLVQALAQAREVNKAAYQGNLPFPDVPFHFFTYVASHDENPRLASFLQEARGQGMGRTVDQAYRLAGYYLFTCGRYPVIYEGDELMQPGFKWKGGAPPNGDGSGVFDETLREPFPWFKSGSGSGQTRWFSSRFDQANDGVSVEEENNPSGMLDLWRGLTNLRSRHPALANGAFGAIANDDGDWRVFEKVQDDHRYLVLMNQTNQGQDYRFHDNHLPAYRRARVLFWSNGTDRTWKDQGEMDARINGTVFVPPYGLVILQP